MAITANIAVVTRGISINGAYLKIPSVRVTKYAVGDDASYRLMYDVHIFRNKSVRDAAGVEQPNPSVRVPELKHFTATYNPASDDNPWAQAYTHLKTQTTYLASIANA